MNENTNNVYNSSWDRTSEQIERKQNPHKHIVSPPKKQGFLRARKK